MKKIFTLLFAVGSITFVSAQPGTRGRSEDDRFAKTHSAGTSHDYGKNNPGYESSSFSVRERDAQLRKINWEFDRKVSAVKMNRRLRNSEKSWQLRMLEKQRAEEIRQVHIRFEKNRRNTGSSRRYDNYRSR